MATVQRFEELEVWKTARELTRRVYRLTAEGPFAKDFGLRDQIRRAAVSVMSNIAEGFEGRTQRIFIDLLGRARGSAGEVRSQLYVALDQDYLSKDDFRDAYRLAEKVSRQLHRFIAYLETQPNTARVKEEEAGYDV